MRKESSDQIRKEMQKQLQECQKAKQEYLEGWQRAKADFVNYKRREDRIANEQANQSVKSLLLKWLPILDNFERLEEASKSKKANIKNLKVAVSQIKNQVNQFLSENKIVKIKTKDQEFDPHFHEAIECLQSSKPKNTIIEEIMPGYLIEGKLLRPAKVKLAK